MIDVLMYPTRDASEEELCEALGWSRAIILQQLGEFLKLVHLK
jgi:hypothetical protein